MAEERPGALWITYDGVLEPAAASQVLPYLRAFARGGTPPTLLSFEKLRWRNTLERARGTELRSELASLGVRWVRLRYHKRPRLAAKAYDLLRGGWTAAWLLVRRGNGVVHCRSLMAAAMGWLPARLLGRKFVFDTRGLLSEQYVAGGLVRRGSLLEGAVRNVERFLLRRADAAVVLTHRDASGLAAMGVSAPVQVIPSCVDLGRYRPARSKDRAAARRRLGLGGGTVLCYMGKVGTWYLFEETVEFFREARGRWEGGIEVLVLSPDDPSRISPILERRGLGDIARVVSARPEEIPALLPACDAGVFFIRSEGKEGSSPIKLAEFLAIGLPVVINKGVGETEALVRGDRVGVVVESLTAEAYRTGSEELRGLLRQGERLTRRCRRVAERNLGLDRGLGGYQEAYARIGEARSQ